MALVSGKFKTGRSIVGGSGRAYNLSRQICIVSSRGMLVNKELTSREHITSLLCYFIHLAPISKAEGILDSGLICGDGLKYGHKI